MFVLTKAQRRAVFDLFRRSSDGSKSYRDFRRRVRPMLASHGAICVPAWCGMLVGIEPDGYMHT